MPTHARRLGYVFQEASLFPHLTARGNLRYGWKRTPPAERRIGEDEVIALMDLAPLLARLPDQLSGGERQRVALARALLTSPRLLLMDEPLAALDLPRKLEILPYLERLRDELDIPIVYVSHSHDEVIRLADHLVLLEAGRVKVAGPLAETLARIDRPVALGAEASVMVEAVVAEHDENYHLSRLDFRGGSVLVARRREAVGGHVRFRVHARDVSLTLARAEGTSINNLLPVTVTDVAPADHPAYMLVRVEADGTPLLARVTRRSCDHLALVPGVEVWAQIKTVALFD